MKKRYLVEGPVTQSVIGEYLTDMGTRNDTGGHSLFLGQVRADKSDEKLVAAIEYSAYNEMVETEAERITAVTKAAFPDVHNIEIVHSTGVVKAGELSLLVLVTAGHRDQAMRACRNVVELIKANYPVWKKELFHDSTHRWKENSK